MSGIRAERYQVVLHVDADTLSPDREPGRSNLEDGMRLAAETARRMTCDSSVVRVLRGREGEVLDVGRKARTVPPALRRALEIRDRGCRFPGCGLRFTEAHHIEHWSEGGETNLKNTLLLCRFHHRKVHEAGWRVVYNPKDDTALIFGPRGQVRADRPDLRGTGERNPAAALTEANRRHGAEPDGWTAAPRYRREADRPWAAQARALEALDRAEDRDNSEPSSRREMGAETGAG